VNGLVGAIGNTPLVSEFIYMCIIIPDLSLLKSKGKSIQIRLKGLSEETGSDILGKAEFMNPGGSVKDRAALFVVKEAEEKGLKYLL
jgi:hypothetical protein